MTEDLDTGRIRNWRSIITLIVFVLTNVAVLFPFHIPIYVPQRLSSVVLDTLRTLRVISPRRARSQHGFGRNQSDKVQSFVRLDFPMDFVTAPLIADLFLLAISAIGRQEVHDGTVGANNISPIDVMVFFLSLAYIAISIDASGLIRYLAFKVLQKGGKLGPRLFFYLYAFFFGLASFIGNDPIILSGTPFLAYMTRVSRNIASPRAWIFTQFAVANIASAILVSSNPTNLVLAGAFEIKFINYTANMIIPVVITTFVLFPFLLYVVFADESLIPLSIQMHELSEEAKAKKPVNPNVPRLGRNARVEPNECPDDEQDKLLPLEEIMNPFLDRIGAAVGSVVMAATLITVLVLNAVSQSTGEHPVFWVTLPAAFVMFCWDVNLGWTHRHKTRHIARNGFEHVRDAQDKGVKKEEEEGTKQAQRSMLVKREEQVQDDGPTPQAECKKPPHEILGATSHGEAIDEKRIDPERVKQGMRAKSTLESLGVDAYRWLRETFPTATAVVTHLPFKLVPFALSMFVLVQALVTKGWVAVFAKGWDHWVDKTGTIGAIGGMGFLSVILCNFAGTNIGTTILLSRVIQAWQSIHRINGIPISDRTFWATVYSMALGVNYGAFSAAPSAALAGLLWQSILARKHIHVGNLEFARVNLPIISLAMAVGCAVLIGEVYIIRDSSPYDS